MSEQTKAARAVDHQQPVPVAKSPAAVPRKLSAREEAVHQVADVLGVTKGSAADRFDALSRNVAAVRELPPHQADELLVRVPRELLTALLAQGPSEVCRLLFPEKYPNDDATNSPG